MVEDCSKSAAEGKQKLTLLGNVLHAAVYPLSAIAGFTVANIKLHRETYDTLKRFGRFKSLYAELEPRNQANLNARGAGLIDLETFNKEAQAIKTAYGGGVEKIMETYLGEGKGTGRFLREWNYVNRSSKLESTMYGITAVTVALGGLMYLTNSQAFNDFFQDKSQDHMTR